MKFCKQRKIDDCVITSLNNILYKKFSYNYLLKNLGTNVSLQQVSSFLSNENISHCNIVTNLGFQTYFDDKTIEFDVKDFDEIKKSLVNEDLFDIKKIFENKKGLIATKLENSKSLHCLAFDKNIAYCSYYNKKYTFEDLKIFEILYIK